MAERRLGDVPSRHGPGGANPTIYDNYEITTEVIVASVRNPLHVLDAALMGADIATVPYKVIEQLIRHPLTDLGVQAFLADWEKVRTQ